MRANARGQFDKLLAVSDFEGIRELSDLLGSKPVFSDGVAEAQLERLLSRFKISKRKGERRTLIEYVGKIASLDPLNLSKKSLRDWFEVVVPIYSANECGSAQYSFLELLMRQTNNKPPEDIVNKEYERIIREEKTPMPRLEHLKWASHVRLRLPEEVAQIAYRKLAKSGIRDSYFLYEDTKVRANLPEGKVRKRLMRDFKQEECIDVLLYYYTIFPIKATREEADSIYRVAIRHSFASLLGDDLRKIRKATGFELEKRLVDEFYDELLAEVIEGKLEVGMYLHQLEEDLPTLRQWQPKPKINHEDAQKVYRRIIEEFLSSSVGHADAKDFNKFQRLAGVASDPSIRKYAFERYAGIMGQKCKEYDEKRMMDNAEMYFNNLKEIGFNPDKEEIRAIFGSILDASSLNEREKGKRIREAAYHIGSKNVFSIAYAMCIERGKYRALEQLDDDYTPCGLYAGRPKIDSDVINGAIDRYFEKVAAGKSIEGILVLKPFLDGFAFDVSRVNDIYSALINQGRRDCLREMNGLTGVPLSETNKTALCEMRVKNR